MVYREMVRRGSGLYLQKASIMLLMVSMLASSCYPSTTPLPTNTPLPTFTPTQQVGAIYYVSPNGSDSNPGTQASPWKTIQEAADTVISGSIVIVQDGSYAERVVISRSGAASAPITFQAQGTVVMRGFTILANYITIRGFEITDTANDDTTGWGVYVHASNCVIENNYIHYATRGGILLFAQPGSESLTANCIVRNNRLYRNSMVGIDVRGKNHLVENNEIWGTIQYHPLWVNPPSYVDADGIRFFGSGHIFRGNYIHDISLTDPLNVNPHIDAFQTWDDQSRQAGSNCTFEQNKIILGNTAAGFQLEGGVNNLIIRNNIINAFQGLLAYKSGDSLQTSPGNISILNNLFIGSLTYIPSDYPVGISIRDTTNAIIKNNIIVEQRDQVIHVTNGSGVDIDYNLAFNSDGSIPVGTPHIHDLWNLDPLFVNPIAGDFHLQAGSPAIDSGISLINVMNDLDGIIRPQGLGTDIGPYEQ